MKKRVFLFLIALMLLLTGVTINAQQFDPGSGNTVLLIGQTFQNEYQGYIDGAGLTPAGGSHYGSLYLGTIEQGDDDPNSAFLDWIRTNQSNPYALVAVSIKDNTAAGGYGQMINDAWPEFNSNAVWEACNDIRNGAWDTQIDQFAQTFASRPDVKFYVRVGYEVSLLLFAYKGEQYVNDWLNEQAGLGINVFDDPDAVADMDRQAYIDAYNHIAQRIKSQATNVDFVYHPVRGTNDTRWLYPGDQYVDWVGFSIFNNDICMEVNGTFNCEGQVIDAELQASMDFAKSHGKPLMVAEAACQAPATESSQQFNTYLSRLHNVIVANDIRVLSYINSDWPAHGWDANWGDSRVEVNSTVRNHWTGIYGSGSRYIHSGGGSGVTPTCDDGIQNGNETGIDCGGDCDPCSTTTDCAGDCPPGYDYFLCGQCWVSLEQAQSGGCTEICDGGGISPTCNDGIQNGNETGVDCGGDCDPCSTTTDCAGDCPPGYDYFLCGQCWVSLEQAQSGGCTETCDGGGTSPTCNDGIQNGNETGVDCGGDCDPCQPADPTCYDGIQNQGETGVDCGGPCAPCGTSGDDPLAGARLLPPDKKILLSIGQDLKTELDYVNGGVNDRGFPVPGAVVAYNSFHTLDERVYPEYGALGESPDGTPFDVDVNWGAGPLNTRKAADGYPESALVIALNIADGGDPGDVWCSGCLSQIGSGAWDNEIRALAAFCNRRPNEPIYLRIGFEFDGKWNLGYSNVNDFKNAWRRIVDVMRQEGVSNVAYVWQSSTSPIDDIIEGKHENIEDWWPGDNYVDWLGLSWFLLPDEKPLVGGYNPHTQKQLADEVIALARSKNKPVLIAESTPQGYDLTNLTRCHISSVWDGAAATGCESMSALQIWNEWFVPYFNYIYTNQDVIRHVTYINVNWDDDTDKFGSGSGYAEGYWGRAGVHVNNTVASYWKNEITKSVWAHGGPANNSGNLKNAINKASIAAHQHHKQGLTIFPNPTNGFITIEGIAADAEIRIYDTKGVLLRIDQGVTQIDVTDFDAGLYIIQSNDQKTMFFKQ